MRISRRSATFLALAAAAALAVAGMAFAGNTNTSNIDFKFQPKDVPKRHFQKGQLHVHSHTDFEQPGNKPAGGFTHRVQLYFDDDFKFNTTGVPKCNPAGFTSNDTMKVAMQKCGSAKVSKSGTAHTAQLGSGVPPTGAPPFDACVLAFNGTRQNGHATIVLFTRVFETEPRDCSSPSTNEHGNVSTVLVGELKPSPASVGGDFGTQLDVNNIDQGQLPLDDFETTIKRGQYVSARCHDSNHKWNMKGKHTYSDLVVDRESAPPERCF